MIFVFSISYQAEVKVPLDKDHVQAYITKEIIIRTERIKKLHKAESTPTITDNPLGRLPIRVKHNLAFQL